ncbi:MAG: hypothetical protein GF334_04475 [Candidatus Altiarchaeales archaeon]|nr:hypothetical protein [Candidatus Altiarchaeales archaeon]
MSDAQLMHEWEQILTEQSADATARNTPVTVEDVKDQNLTQLFADKILSWPTYDLRLETLYQQEHCTTTTDSAFMIDVAAGMKTRLRAKDMEHGMVWVDVLFQTNMAEFERYNLTVQQHNEDWYKMGSPTDVFDPKTGDVHPVSDNYIARATTKNIPQTLKKDTSTGPLAKARPTAKHSVGVTVQYKVSLKGSAFILEYAARDATRDAKGRVLYFDRDKGHDLTTLIRHSVQGLWGNHKLYGDEGAFLDGIPQLLRGHKAETCVQGHVRPAFAEGPIKDITLELVVSSLGRELINGVAIPILGYVLPIVLTFFALISVLVHMGASQRFSGFVWWPYVIYPLAVHAGKPFTSFFITEILLLTIMYICVKTSHRLARKVSALQMREKFL